VESTAWNSFKCLKAGIWVPNENSEIFILLGETAICSEIEKKTINTIHEHS